MVTDDVAIVSGSLDLGWLVPGRLAAALLVGPLAEPRSGPAS